MTIIHRYLIKELLKYFCMVLAGVVCVYLAVDFFEKIDDFLEAGVPMFRVLVFFAMRLAHVVSQVMPVGVLLAVLIVFGLMVRNNEILALKGGGVSSGYLWKPVVFLGVVFGALLFVFSEGLVPISTWKANRIWRSEVKNRPAITSRNKDIWIKGNHSILHVRYYVASEQAVFGMTVNYFDRDFRLKRRIDAEKGIYVGGAWHLYDVMEQDLPKDEVRYSVISRKEAVMNLEFEPEDISRVAKKPTEMGYGELASYIRRIESEGYDATSYRVDLAAKLAFPFVCIVMTVVGAGLTFWRQSRDGLAGNVFFGIITAFLYWTVHSLCLSLGYGATLPPVIAAWLTNVLFLSLGLYALLSAD
jgi:lipopolysaccharide export system permease protein